MIPQWPVLDWSGRDAITEFARFRVVLQRALLQRLIGAEYLDRVLAQVPESLEVAS